ncbi:MAG: hypothetical protein ACYCSF_13185 [Acidimicrobiales bacterium]
MNAYAAQLVTAGLRRRVDGDTTPGEALSMLLAAEAAQMSPQEQIDFACRIAEGLADLSVELLVALASTVEACPLEFWDAMGLDELRAHPAER